MSLVDLSLRRPVTTVMAFISLVVVGLIGAWSEAIAIAREFPHVHLELTAVLDDRGPLELFCRAGLARQLLFGTDLPWFNPHHGIGSVLSAEIDDEARHDILHRNAEKLLAGVGVFIA